MRPLIFCIGSLLCAIACAAPASQPIETDMATLRDRLVHSILPREARAQQQIQDEAKRVASQMNDAGTWDDIDFTDTARTFWKPQQHTDRLLLMCRAYRISRDAGQTDPKLHESIHGALDYWLAHDYQNPNWWHNQIGTPELIGQSILLLQPDVTAQQVDKSLEILRRSTWEKWTGQNLVWGVTIQIVRAVISNDTEAITQAFARMYAEIQITQKEGIQPDFSFHQHGDQFYSGGYGLAFAQDVSRYISFGWGTRWQAPDDKVAIFESYLLDGEQWMMHGSRFDYSGVGREITRKGKTAVPHSWTSGPISPVGAAYGLFNSVALLAQQPIPRRDELSRLVDRMRGDVDPPLVGNRHFWCSDYMTHHRPGWMSSVRMFSSRLVNTEIVNDEGKKSQHLADGCNLLYVTGDEYLDIFPVWDWTKIPGTTAEQTLEVEAGHRGGIAVRGKTSFVGGVSDGALGLAAMHLSRGSLDAHKAWFFFDEGYLCFGSGITDSSDQEVVTTIEQSRLTGSVDHAENWVHHASTGYLMGKSALFLTTETQEGSWFDIGMGSSQKLSQKVFKLWIDHGTKPVEATYAYVVLPGASLGETKERAMYWPASVIVNTPEVLAAMHEKTHAIACAFAKPGSLKADGGRLRISVDQPCLLLLRDGKLTLANPENKKLTVNVRITDRSFSVELPDGQAAGSSVSIPLR